MASAPAAGSAAIDHSHPASTPRAAQAPWIDFTAPSGEFEATFPEAPVTLLDSISTAVGPQAVRRFKVRTEAAEFDAGYLERAPSLLAKLAGQSRILQAACEGTAEHMGGTLIESRAMTLDGLMARELRIEGRGAEHWTAVARLAITDDRIYHAIVKMVPHKARGVEEDALAFVTSFHPRSD